MDLRCTGIGLLGGPLGDCVEDCASKRNEHQEIMLSGECKDKHASWDLMNELWPLFQFLASEISTCSSLSPAHGMAL